MQIGFPLSVAWRLSGTRKSREGQSRVAMLDIRGYNGVGQHPLLVLPVMLRVCRIYCIARGAHAPWFAPCFGRGIAHRMDKELACEVGYCNRVERHD